MITFNRSGSMVSMILVGALLSGNGLAEEPAPAATNTAVFAAKTAPPHQPLDLRAPLITQLYTAEELNRILATTFIREDIEEVQVEGERERRPTDTPDVWPGIAAPVWALLNPAQSWRIFAPLPPDQTRDQSFVRANATDTYLLEPAGTPSPFAH
ncbi:hypothetical protein [Peristeroidobacter agariperforans]|uniref:hypothetical protein n=1 Tax=Peristeroidobacter agariperforans TaxID=268404 RepID=UPI00101CB1E8|nr:hypothetical protein [Peristeroidobacter agariperforans]